MGASERSRHAALRQPALTPSPHHSWTALVFVAGFGYYTVKTRNDVKRKLLMETEAEEARRATGTPEGAYAAGASSRRRAGEYMRVG